MPQRVEFYGGPRITTVTAAPALDENVGSLALRHDAGNAGAYVKTSTGTSGWTQLTTTGSGGLVTGFTAAPTILDTFAGADASVVAAKNWTVAVSGVGAADINGQRARFVTAAAGSFADYVALQAKMASHADVEILAKYEFGVMTAERYFGFALRSDVPNYWGSNGISFRFGNSTSGVVTPVIDQTVSGSPAFLFTGSTFSATAGDTYIVRFRAQGSTVSAKYWASSLPEPTTWNAVVTTVLAANNFSAQLVNRSGVAASSETAYVHWAQVTAL